MLKGLLGSREAAPSMVRVPFWDGSERKRETTQLSSSPV